MPKEQGARSKEQGVKKMSMKKRDLKEKERPAVHLPHQPRTWGLPWQILGKTCGWLVGWLAGAAARTEGVLERQRRLRGVCEERSG